MSYESQSLRPRDIYVDSVGGKDSNSRRPLRRHRVRGRTWASDRGLIVRGFTSDPAAHSLSGSVRIAGCRGGSPYFASSDLGAGIRFLHLTTTSHMRIFASAGVELTECHPRRSTYAVDCYHSLAVVRNCDFGENESEYAIGSSLGSTVVSYINYGQARKYGLYAWYGGSIRKHSRQPTGLVEDEFTESGGMIQ